MRIGIGSGVCFGARRNPLAAYAAAGFVPKLVANFTTEFYAKEGRKSTFGGVLESTATTNGTMVDSDGLLKWRPHNEATNPTAPASQTISVVSGADYTVECTGVSIVLSGAGTGTVTEGNPVEITAGSTSLTLTVTGSTGTLWAYRSDLGGMVNNPDTGTSFVPTTGYLPRRNHYVYNGSAWVKAGTLIEPQTRTNLLLNSGGLSTQSVTVSATPHTLHFTGTGSITLSGAHSATLAGTGTGEENRVSLTFTPSAGTLVVTVSGTVTNAQLEEGSTPSSYIPTSGSQVARAGEQIVIPHENISWPAGDELSIHIKGLMTGQSSEFVRWRLDASNYIALSSGAGDFTFSQSEGGTVDSVTGGSFTSGTNVSFNIASRHGSTFINGAVDGTALTENTTPTTFPDLENTNLQLAYSGGAMVIKEVSLWDVNIEDAGTEDATDD